MQNKIAVKNFSLKRTLTCGQTFRVFEKNGVYIYPYGNSVLALRQEGDSLFYESFGEKLNEWEVKNLLGLNDEVGFINEYLKRRVPEFSKVINETLGIRIMRQKPFETVISFMFSVQSAIPLITRRLNTLSKIAGKKVQTPYGKFYLFPKSENLKKLTDLEIKSLKLGFREKWFREFIERYDEKELEKIARLPFAEKEKELLKIKGVGIKVAHCIMLFSMNELSAFPVDVWIKRGMKTLFGTGGSVKKITHFGRELFGDFAGYAQEYIYYCIRNGAEGGT